MKYKDLHSIWLMESKNKGLKKTSLDSYENISKTNILPYLGDTDLKKVTHEQVQEIADKVIKKSSRSSARTTVQLINQVMTFADQNGYATWARNAKLPEPEKKERSILAPDEEQRLRNYLLFSEDYNCIPPLIALCTGMKTGEIGALQWKDIDTHRKLIHINSRAVRVKIGNGKVKTMLIEEKLTEPPEKRDIAIPAQLMAKLEEQRRRPLVYVASGFTALSEPRTMAERLKRITTALDINNCTYITLRNTFSLKYLEKGEKIWELPEILGKATLDAELIDCIKRIAKTREGKKNGVVRQ